MSDLGSGRFDAGNIRPAFLLERPDLGSEKPDWWSERPVSGFKRLYFGSKA